MICKYCNLEKPKPDPKLHRLKCDDCYNSYMREWYLKHREKKLQETRTYAQTPKAKSMRIKSYKRMKEKYPEKYKARYTLFNAMQRGEVSKQSFCASCYSELNIEGHHEDYSKPLEVEWLCQLCHKAKHNKLVINYKRRTNANR